MYQSKSRVFNYYNLFPSDVTETGRFLLSAMSFMPPLHEHALKLMLKPLVCDDVAPKTCKELVRAGYLYCEDTNSGKFYALTAKTHQYLDYEQKNSHCRRDAIKPSNLLSFRLQSLIIAERLVSVATAVFLEEWHSLPVHSHEEYLNMNGLDKAAFDAALVEKTVATIDVLPRSIVQNSKVISALENAILSGTIPYTDCHNPALYENLDAQYPALARLHAYDWLLQKKMTIAARQNANKSDPALVKELAVINNKLNLLSPQAGIFLLNGGQKAITLSLLQANGIFLEDLGEETVHFGLINNKSDGLTARTLSGRIDLMVSLALALGRESEVTIYTLADDQQAVNKNLKQVLDRLSTKIDVPAVHWTVLPTTAPPCKYARMRGLKK
ncbi:MAG: hypothetical protein H6Q60_826 [Oscillospiraceae bacterium]|nr:hypothetical protein [Oscillospiraceae bacterium]